MAYVCLRVISACLVPLVFAMAAAAPSSGSGAAVPAGSADEALETSPLRLALDAVSEAEGAKRNRAFQDFRSLLWRSSPEDIRATFVEGDAAELIVLGQAVAEFQSGRADVATRMLESLVADSGDDAVLLLNARINLGTLALYKGEARAAFDIFLDILRMDVLDPDDPDYAVQAHRNALITTANVLGFQKDYDGALGYYAQALELTDREADVVEAARIRTNRANVYMMLGHLNAAVDDYHAALKVVRAEGERFGEANILSNLAMVYEKLQWWDEAISYGEDALAVAQELENVSLMAQANIKLANAYLTAGRLDDARAQALRGLSAARDLESQIEELKAMEIMSHIAAAQGRYVEADDFRDKRQALETEMMQAAQLIETTKLREAFSAERRTLEIETLEAENASQAARLRAQRLTVGGLVGGAVLLVVLLCAVISARRAEASRATLAGQMRERERIAGELHDSLLQSVSGAAMALEAAQGGAGSSKRELDLARGLMRRSLREAREAVWQLRAERSTGHDLHADLRQAFERLSALLGVPGPTLDVRGVPAPMDAPICHALVDVIKEAVANSLEHTRSTPEVILHYHTEGIEAWIRDRGPGFDAAARPPGHWGLTLMRERTQAHGGTLRVESAPDAGTQVRVTLPYHTQGRVKDRVKPGGTGGASGRRLPIPAALRSRMPIRIRFTDVVAGSSPPRSASGGGGG